MYNQTSYFFLELILPIILIITDTIHIMHSHNRTHIRMLPMTEPNHQLQLNPDGESTCQTVSGVI